MIFYFADCSRQADSLIKYKLFYLHQNYLDPFTLSLVLACGVHNGPKWRYPEIHEWRNKEWCGVKLRPA